jgi:peptidoglycan/LPS O-acetylase OafA/YrhL
MGVSSGEGDRRLAGIEGLRACAALSVLTCHVVNDHPRGGSQLGAVGVWLAWWLGAGLTLFFALSGFLLFRPIAAAIVDGRELPDVGRYLRRRALRILPAYWVILLVVALGLGAAHVAPTAYAYGYLTDPATLGKDMLLVQGYSPSSMLTGIAPGWSLCAEVVFYILLPLLALPASRLAAGRGPRGRLVAALLPAGMLFVVGTTGKLWAAATFDPANGWNQSWGATWHAVLERSFLASADLFAFGMVAAVITIAAARGLVQVSLVRAVGGRLALWLIPLAVLFCPLLDARLYNSLMGLAFAGLLTSVTLPAERGVPRLVRALERRPVVLIGVISYSIYLWHQPITIAVERHGLAVPGAAGVAVNLSVVIAVTIALATVTYRFVERPAMARGVVLPARFRPRHAPLPELR